MLELQILAANVLLPTAIVALTLCGLHFANHSRAGMPRETDSEGLAGLEPSDLVKFGQLAIFVSASALAVWLAFGLRVPEAFALWPEDAWCRIPHAITVVALGSILSASLRLTPVAWIVRVASLWVAAKMTIPVGEAWEFLQPTAYLWTAIMVLSPLICIALTLRLVPPVAGTLGLSWIACVAAAAFLSKDFLRVTEPMLAIASVLGCASLATLLTQRTTWVSSMTGPCVFGCGAAVASFQFNSFLGLPDTLSWLAIAAPALAGLLTLGFSTARSRRSHGNDSGVVLRQVGITIGSCLILATIVVVWTMISGGGAGEAWD